MKKNPLSILALAIVVLAGCCSQQSKYPGPITTGDDTIAHTIYGDIQGYCDNGIYTFKGIKYAKTERFMPPQFPDKFEGVMKCQSYGPVSPQGQSFRWGTKNDYDFGFEFKLEPEDEANCTVLNVWTPALDGKKRPVFVWIHGGGYASGSAIFLPAQEGRALAEKGDIVVVTVNHRLNILGYIDLTAFGGKYAESVNLGMQDLVKALEWVNMNIENFGGDPACVTIGGQSGGGGKTSTLCAMPSAKGLFHRAIVQSGSTLRQAESAQSQAYGVEIIKQLGLDASTIDKVSEFSYQELVAAGNRAARTVGGRFSPVVDGKFLTHHPFDPAPEESFDVPMLIGSNLNEFCYTNNVHFTMDEVKDRMVRRFGNEEKFEAYRAEFEKVYPGQEPKELLNTDFNTRSNVLRQASIKSTAGGAKAYVYLFAWKSPVNDFALAACHGMELPFMFNNVAAQREMTGGTPEAYKVADAVSSAWISFIKTGDPNCKKLPEWEPFTEESGATMILDNVSELKHYHDAGLIQFALPRR